MVAGEAGQGVQSAGFILSKALARGGYSVSIQPAGTRSSSTRFSFEQLFPTAEQYLRD